MLAQSHLYRLPFAFVPLFFSLDSAFLAVKQPVNMQVSKSLIKSTDMDRVKDNYGFIKSKNLKFYPILLDTVGLSSLIKKIKNFFNVKK